MKVQTVPYRDPTESDTKPIAKDGGIRIENHEAAAAR